MARLTVKKDDGSNKRPNAKEKKAAHKAARKNMTRKGVTTVENGQKVTRKKKAFGRTETTYTSDKGNTITNTKNRKGESTRKVKVKVNF